MQCLFLIDMCGVVFKDLSAHLDIEAAAGLQIVFQQLIFRGADFGFEMCWFEVWLLQVERVLLWDAVLANHLGWYVLLLVP